MKGDKLMIKIVGLGPGSLEALTIGTLELLKSSDYIFFRTEKHPTVDYLKKMNIKFKTYDSAYDEYDSFDEVYRAIAEDVIEQYRKIGSLIYGVPGHPFVAEKSVSILMDLCEKEGISFEVLPAVSFIDAMMEALRIDPVEGMKIIDAFDIKDQILDKRVATIITQVYNKLIASEVKLKLSEYYRDDTDIYFVRAAGIKNMESIRKIKLYELDRQEDIDYLTSVFIPRDLKHTEDFYDLLNIMDLLRSREGCPWDREQTHESLKKYLVEESYEVLEAIDEQDYDKIVEELGDVLLQIVFHSAIGKEDGYFNINDVVKAICKKMIERHPHVFGSVEVKDSSEVLSNWDEIKRKEKGIESRTEEMNKIAKSLPALARAGKIQSKARKIGFDWDKVEDAMDKVLEEFYEVKDVYNGENRARILEEIGDLIFACVNVARFLDIDPELALNNTNDKFIKRFSYIENSARNSGRRLEEMSLGEMDLLWNESKKK
jgi:tetrapyrrole methylase family protein / MazG family protein